MPKQYSYSDFWKMRGRQTIWVTQQFSYRVGSFLALIASRLGLSPHLVSVLSSVVTICSALLAVHFGQDAWFSAVVLIVGLQLGYALDCTDGLLARTCGMESSFGVILDKVSDFLSSMVFPVILATGAATCACIPSGKETLYTVYILMGAMVSRALLSMLLWFKDQLLYSSDHLRKDKRKVTLFSRFKKVAALYIDEPVYRLAIALAWSMSWYWEFLVIYSVGILVLFIGYLISSKSELDAFDKANVVK